MLMQPSISSGCLATCGITIFYGAAEGSIKLEMLATLLLAFLKTTLS
jgi:hypothetical protein